ncbi:MAG: histone deacetylase [Chloroflexaceae bacterium]|nr:histone deacetylase [Chloroflexaceae bacterium]NJO05807.1 histone deacetylase [Chloroflexaceae bacterium]
MTTAILTDQRFLVHDDPSHVERAERLRAIYHALDESGLRSQALALEPRAATPAELLAVHTQQHLDTIQRFGTHGGGYLDTDTYMVDGSWEAAVLASGGVIQAVEAVVQGISTNAFAFVRPPGHHATPTRAMGFCLINNIGVGARYALQQLGLSRVAIVDYDVHHGNGTQDIFYEDPQVLFCSTHAAPYYPGTGRLDEVGQGAGLGATLNVPLTFGVGDKGYVQVFNEIIIPALHRWKPELLLVSAGYDAHWSDPIGPMVVSAQGFAQMTHMLANAAAELCNGRIVLVLEGGYNLNGLAASALASLQVLMGQNPKADDMGRINAPEPDLAALLNHIRQRHPLFATE